MSNYPDELDGTTVVATPVDGAGLPDPEQIVGELVVMDGVLFVVCRSDDGYFVPYEIFPESVEPLEDLPQDQWTVAEDANA